MANKTKTKNKACFRMGVDVNLKVGSKNIFP